MGLFNSKPENTFQVVTANNLFSAYTLLRGMKEHLNDAGKDTIEQIENTQKEMKEKNVEKSVITKFGVDSVYNLFNGNWINLTKSPEKEKALGKLLSELNHIPTLYNLQEVSEENLNDILSSAADASYDKLNKIAFQKYDFSLEGDGKFLEKYFQRGNAILSSTGFNIKDVMVFPFKKSVNGKDKTRYMVCSIVEKPVNGEILRFASCNVQVSGYDSTFPTINITDESAIKNFKDSYKVGLDEMTSYSEQLDNYIKNYQEKNPELDMIIISGDFNSDKLTNSDSVENLGINNRDNYLIEKGFIESETATEPTTQVPAHLNRKDRLIDRIFMKTNPNSKFTVTKFETKIINYGEYDPLYFSDHKFVRSVIEVNLKQ